MERIIQAEKPIFIIPKDSNPDYRELKSKLENFGKSKIVDDVEEIKVLVAQQAAIDPYKIEEKLIPRLR